MDAAVAAARAALSGPWGKMPQAERATMVRAIADGINKRFDDFLEAEVLDTGKPYSVASHVDIPRGGANFATFADVLREHPTEAFRMDTPDGLGALNYGVRRPRGVIGIISPWNLPLLLMTWKAGPALACATPWSSSRRRSPPRPPPCSARSSTTSASPRASTTSSTGSGRPVR